MLKLGMIKEFVGSMNVIDKIEEIEVDDMVKIMKEKKNEIVKKYKRMLEMENVEMVLNEDELREIEKKDVERKKGERGMSQIMEKIMIDKMFEMKKMEGVREVVIQGDVVDGRERKI